MERSDLMRARYDGGIPAFCALSVSWSSGGAPLETVRERSGSRMRENWSSLTLHGSCIACSPVLNCPTFGKRPIMLTLY